MTTTDPDELIRGSQEHIRLAINRLVRWLAAEGKDASEAELRKRAVEMGRLLEAQVIKRAFDSQPRTDSPQSRSWHK